MPKATQKLEASMRFIYAHFLEDGESLAGFMQTRRRPAPNIRHIVRKKLYRQYGCSYKELARTEGRFNNGTPPDESTISHSINKAEEKYENYQDASRVVKQLMAQFDDYWMGMQETSIRQRLQHYYNMPHHVLAVIACFAEGYGWVGQHKMDGLHTEWQTVSPEMIESEIKKLNK